MGQYYNLANLNKKLNINEGKFMEFCWVKNSSMELLMTLLSTEWKRNKIVTCGDYSTDVAPYEFPSINEESYEINNNLSQEGYIYNIDTLERINMKLYLKFAYNDHEDSGYDYYIHPLATLTISENSGGGGDYNNDHDPMVGAWSGNRLFTSKSRLKRYKDITYKVYPKELSGNDAEEYLTELKRRKLLFNVNNF
jgi:hypothetical protein